MRKLTKSKEQKRLGANTQTEKPPPRRIDGTKSSALNLKPNKRETKKVTTGMLEREEKITSNE